MQALNDGRRRQQGIALALMSTSSVGPAPAILEGAVPRVLTDEGDIHDSRDGNTIFLVDSQDDALHQAKMRVLALANELVALPSPSPAPTVSNASATANLISKLDNGEDLRVVKSEFGGAAHKEEVMNAAQPGIKMEQN